MGNHGRVGYSNDRRDGHPPRHAIGHGPPGTVQSHGPEHPDNHASLKVHGSGLRRFRGHLRHLLRGLRGRRAGRRPQMRARISPKVPEWVAGAPWYVRLPALQGSCSLIGIALSATLLGFDIDDELGPAPISFKFLVEWSSAQWSKAALFVPPALPASSSSLRCDLAASRMSRPATSCLKFEHCQSKLSRLTLSRLQPAVQSPIQSVAPSL